MSRYNEILRGVERPGRYMGQEFGLPPQLTQDPRLRVVLGFPDVYEVGMSHLGFRLLHAGLLNLPADERIQVDRGFLPQPDLQQALQREGIPLASLESQAPLGDFDLLCLSVQFELAFPALIKMLDLAQLPRQARARLADEARHPLLLVGGSAALNPEPLAPFVDCFFLGEADLALPRMVRQLAELGPDAPRAEQLARLARVPGVYVPSLVEVEYAPDSLQVRSVKVRPPATLPVERQYVADLDDLPVPEPYLVPTCELVHDRVTLEIQRGCSQGCRFCQAGFVTRPTRQRGAESVLEAARRLLEHTGYQSLALLSLSAGDHPCLQEILAALIQEHGPRRVAVSLPSMRTETMHPTVAQQVSRLRRTTFTLAPEAATDRLRRVINKQNDEQDLLDAVEAVVQAGCARVKLYFMIGLPTETDDDVQAIADLARRVWERGRRLRKSLGLTVSVSTFVPKPHTPLQWEAALEPEAVERKLSILKRALPRRLSLRWHDPGQSLAEAHLARGDRRTAAVLERVVDAEHPGLDAWSEHFHLPRWEAALEAAHSAGEIPDPGLYLGARDPAQALPWEQMDVGVERDYLLAQREAALGQAVRPDCSDGTCDQCGVCPAEPLHRLAQPSAAPAPPAEPEEPPSPSPAADPGQDRRRVRIWFHKRGRAALISHLELAGLLERAARRAGLQLAFSQGFRPKPLLRFTPALPLGARSRCEFLELGLAGDSARLEPEQVLTRLARQLPPGLELRRTEDPGDGLLGRIRGIRWRLAPSPPLGPGELQRSVERLREGPLLLQRKKGPPRDLAAIITELAPVGDGAAEVSCTFGPGGTVKPDEIMTLLWGRSPEDLPRARVTRLAWTFEEP